MTAVLTDDVTLRRLAVSNAAGRIAIGVVFLVAPRAVGARWFGTVGGERAAGVLTRMVAARDLVLGVGMLRALTRREPVRPWFALAVAVESVDGLAAFSARRHLPKWTAAATVAAAGLGALSDAHLAVHLDRRSS
ncbi:MAG: hypothetical protein ACRD29_14905 [Acidimicrobiales bacterium]